jgi:parallel beta-helix repeat protein
MLSLILCMVAVAALLLLAGRPSRAQTPTPRYVAFGGIDASDCTAPLAPCGTVQHAVDVANPGDVIKVAAGTYTGVNSNGGLSQVVYISKTLTIRGGYDAGFPDPPDPAAFPTTLDAGEQGRVIFAIGTTVSITLEGLRLTGGDASGLSPESAGGGFCAEEVSYALLRNSEIVSNTADFGGGAYYHRSGFSLLAASKIYSNTARAGAGVYFHNTGNPTLTDSEVYSNTSTRNGAGIYLATGYFDTILSGNTIHHNASTDGGGGGGVYIKGTNDPWLYNNSVYSNTASSQGGGLYLSDSRNSEVISNTIRDNVGDSNGGGIYVGSSDGCTFAGNRISGNRNTGLTGGGIFLNSSDDATFRDNQIHDNTAEVNAGGGLYASSCLNLSLIGNGIYGNQGTSGGGLYLHISDGATIASNEVYSNTASTGGGIHLYRGEDITFMNNILWANEASAFGSGIRVQEADARFLHTTIARSVGEGIAVVAGSLRMTNTILVSNTVGVLVWTNCTATLTNTLWGDGIWGNTTDWHLQDETSTLNTGTDNFWDYPAFLDPDAGDYHIGPTSGALDRGVDAGVLRDIDDEPRLGVPDLGADEYWVPGAIKHVYLPLIVRNSP